MVKVVKTSLKTKRKRKKINRKHKTNIEKTKKAVEFFMKDFAKEINDET